MRIRVVNDIAGLEALRGAWEALCADSESDVLPLTHAWIVAWWKSFGAGSEAHVVVVYGGDDEILAIAPFMEARTKFRRVSVTKMCLMVNGFAPHSGVIIRRDADVSMIVSLIIQHLVRLRHIDVVELTKVEAEGCVHEAALQYLRGSPLSFGVQNDIESPFIQIATDWDTLVARFPRSFRKQIRRRLRRLDQPDDLTVKEVVVRGRTCPAVEEMIEISSRSWKREVGGHIDGNPGGRELILELCDRFGPCGRVSIWQLLKGLTPIAFEFHVKYGGIAYPLRADYRSEFASLSPGAMLECHILKTLFEGDDVCEYNSCGTTYEYLLRWTNLTRKYVSIQIFARRLLPYALHSLEYRLVPVLRSVEQRMRSVTRWVRSRAGNQR